jgi:hypothetical protein
MEGVDAIARDVNGSDFAFTIFSTMCFHRIWSGADNVWMRIRKRIYLIADSERKWSGFVTEKKTNRIGTFKSN